MDVDDVQEVFLASIMYYIVTMEMSTMEIISMEAMNDAVFCRGDRAQYAMTLRGTVHGDEVTQNRRRQDGGQIRGKECRHRLSG